MKKIFLGEFRSLCYSTASFDYKNHLYVVKMQFTFCYNLMNDDFLNFLYLYIGIIVF